MQQNEAVTAPYREERPLRDLIPPDRRRLRAAIVVLLSMAAGGVLFYAVESAAPLFHREPVLAASPAPARAAKLGPARLHGPRTTQAIPADTAVVLNVWLEGCADCMPAFDAMNALEKAGGLAVGVPVVNVAYGEADTQWAESHGVGRNLVFDPAGAAVVRP